MKWLALTEVVLMFVAGLAGLWVRNAGDDFGRALVTAGVFLFTGLWTALYISAALWHRSFW